MTIDYGYKTFSGRTLTNGQVDALNAVQDRIDGFEAEGRPVPEHLLTGRHNLFLTFTTHDWSTSTVSVKPQQALCGVRSDTLNIYNCQDRLIGYCAPGELEKVSRGDFSGCQPVAGWKNTFSMSLIKRWGLSI
jgi:hypothetical protein